MKELWTLTEEAENRGELLQNANEDSDDAIGFFRRRFHSWKKSPKRKFRTTPLAMCYGLV